MADAFQSFLSQTGSALSPLRTINSPERAVTFFKGLGYEFSNGAFGSALTSLAGTAGNLAASVQELATATGEVGVAAAIANILRNVVETTVKISDLLSELQTNAPAVPDLSDLPRRLTDFLLLEYMDQNSQTAHAMLLLLGAIEHTPDAPTGTPVRKINWERVPDYFSDPGKIVNDVYKWDTDFDSDKFLTRLEGVLRAFTLPGGIYHQSDATRAALGNPTPDLQELRMPIFQKGLTPETYAQFGINFTPAEAQGSKKKGLALLPYLLGTAQFTFTVCDRGELVLESNAELTGIGVVLRPPFDAEGLLNLTGNFRIALKIREKPEAAQEIILIGSAGGTRLAVQGLGATWFLQNTTGQIDAGFQGEIQAIRLVVNGGEGDGFLSQILSGLNVQAEAGLAFGYSLLQGFYLQGNAKLAIELAVHIDLGPLSIQGLKFELAPSGEELKLDAGATIKLDIGPLKAVVENIGLSTKLKFQQGNLGPADLSFGFKPPNGVGLSIDAGAVRGGGYLFFDFDREEYAGVLQLDISGFVTISAIGLITTKMPDGSKGFSLLIIMTVEFSPGIQLGFGFTFVGIGGLIGLNRTVKLEVLAQGIRNGTLNNIMFPQGDIVANAPRIISDLRAIFPPEEGKFLVGPMVKLGWGTPTLISVALGVIIEIPGNFAIVGVLKVGIPTEDAPLILIQIAFIGAVEFDKQRLWFFASMFDSRVLFITLEGEMGLLVSWGNEPNFVVSVGGFHPRFTPPPLPFPSPRRIAIDLSNNPAYRVRIEGYFAVTSNTVQLGARAEIGFGLPDFGINGHISFDALFQFSPFYFIVEISASVRLTVFGFDAFSIRLEFSLEGPTPYRARGSGYISILFWEFSADFDVTWGDTQDTSLPPIKVMPLLKAEFEKIENWKAELPAGSNLLVSMRELKGAADLLVLHPVGVLRISQRAIPLDLTLDKVGSQKAEDGKKFSVQVNTANLGVKGKVDEQFALAQFQNMTDAEKISRPSYEANAGGVDVSVSGNQIKTSKSVKRIVRYETIIIDSNYKRFVVKYFRLISSLFYHFVKGGMVSKNVLSQSFKEQRKPYAEAVQMLPDQYVVAFSSNNAAFTDQAVFSSEAQAREFLRTQVAAKPALQEQLHVIPQFETFSAP
ncbi:MAG TPA: hypothetical protein PLO67_10675 [Saprospiraceae bacterium]|nr:hypothetical protein [Saprospiraceae bacterium]HPI06588.1 hypothetical protein [Saprospiraceae bacterium]